MSPGSFQARYCERMGVIPAAFPTDLLLKALPPHARTLLGLLGAVDRQHFQADYEFIEDVSQIKRPADFWAAAESYAGHPANSGFLRRRLRLRISVRRMLAIVQHVFPDELPPGLMAMLEEQGTIAPFGLDGSRQVTGNLDGSGAGCGVRQLRES